MGGRVMSEVGTEELFDFESEDEDRLVVTPAEIHRTTETAGIKMTSRDILVFVNEYGRPTPILIVAQCELDGIEYGALYDTTTGKRYVVELIKQNGVIKEFRDLVSEFQDEEWGVITNYFLREKVFDIHRINEWIRSQRARHSLSMGKYRIPGIMLKRAQEKSKYHKEHKGGK